MAATGVQARFRYKQKVAICEALLAERLESPMNPPTDPDDALALYQAHQRESEALREYHRLAGIYADLTVRGIVPTENSEP